MGDEGIAGVLSFIGVKVNTYTIVVHLNAIDHLNKLIKNPF